MFVVRPVNIIFLMVCMTVGVLPPSRVVRRRGAVGIRGGVLFLRSIVMSVGVAIVFYGTSLLLTAVFPFNLNFR